MALLGRKPKPRTNGFGDEQKKIASIIHILQIRDRTDPHPPTGEWRTEILLLLQKASIMISEDISRRILLQSKKRKKKEDVKEAPPKKDFGKWT